MHVLSDSSELRRNLHELEILWRESVEKDGIHYQGGFYTPPAQPSPAVAHQKILLTDKAFHRKYNLEKKERPDWGNRYPFMGKGEDF
jgi:hypothetical protein